MEFDFLIIMSPGSLPKSKNFSLTYKRMLTIIISIPIKISVRPIRVNFGILN